MSSDRNSFDLSDQTFLHVSLKHIVASQKQPRKKFPEKSLRELAQSIRVKGVLQPLIVRKHPSLNNFYELVAGERRWRALKKLEVERVPVILRKVNDDEILEVALLENIQRENLTVIDGQIEVSCGESKEKLSKGDTFRFQSNRDHTIKNVSKQKAQVLMVNYIDPVNGSFN